MRFRLTCAPLACLALLWCVPGGTAGSGSSGPSDRREVVLDDFESAPKEWKFIAGWEFPGAKGGLEIDPAVAHGGSRSYRLAADFTGGGRYVGTWRDLQSLKGQDFSELHLWIKSAGVATLGVRLVDGSDQCHQVKDAIHLTADEQWHEYRLKVADLVGGEHWAGANDGKWHGPAKGFGLNIGTDSFVGGAKQGTVWIDDVSVTPGSPVHGQPTLLAATADPPACPPGFATKVTFRWDAEPMGRDYTAFVHFVGPDGKMAFQADHDLPTPTSVWSGRVEYPRHVFIPDGAKDGEYRIVVGLYDRQTGRTAVKAGPGVAPEKGGPEGAGTAWQVGVLKVDHAAPPPALPAPTLDLSKYRMTFHDEFDDLSVSADGAGTRWFTATKENFGDARFVEQKDGFPFSVQGGSLRIEASKHNGAWCSGILASVNRKGEGFSQKYGYFEMRAKFPASPGTWPAFWLMGQPSLVDKKVTNPEIDVVEHYGVSPNAVHSTLHLWPADGHHWGKGDFITAPGLTEGFHTYGVSVDESDVVWYFDGVEVQKQKTPREAKVPLYLLVNLAMGGGWPIDKAVSPSYMEVDYVRAYERKP